jgi:FkbM family methyltransferase
MLTREGHINHTRKELTEEPYFIALITTLKLNKIISYVDVGANIGEFSNILFEQIPTLQDAYLIEPEEGNFTFLQNHIKNKSNLYKTAIGYNFTSGVLAEDINNVGGHSLRESSYVNTSFFNVEIKTLEELELPIVDFLKMDIEGGEFNVIENSNYLQQIRWVDIEFHGLIDAEYIKQYFPGYEIMLNANICNTARYFLKKK